MMVNDFLDSLKADLLDRRLRPFVALVAIGLVAAVVYLAVGGGSQPAPQAASTHATPVAPPSALTISENTHENAIAETTNGGSSQQQGSSHDPFGAIPSATSASTSSASTSASSSGSSATSSGGSSASSSSGGSSSPSPSSSSPRSPESSKPKTIYQLDALFGQVPAGQERSSALSALDDLKLLTPLPSIKAPLLVFRGVRKGGKDATFTVSGEAILSGDGACKPSPYDCEAISLKSGQVEHVQYLPPGSETAVTYELKIVSIHAAEATAAAVASVWRGESLAGLRVLRSANLLDLPGLRESGVAGVLLPAQ